MNDKTKINIIYVIFLLLSGFLVDITISDGKLRIMMIVFALSLIVVTNIIYKNRNNSIKSLDEFKLYLITAAVVAIILIIKYFKNFSIAKIYIPVCIALIIHLAYKLIEKSKQK